MRFCRKPAPPPRSRQSNSHPKGSARRSTRDRAAVASRTACHHERSAKARGCRRPCLSGANFDVEWIETLIGIWVVIQSAIQRLGRKVKMGPEIRWRWGHFGRPPYIPQYQSRASPCCISSVMPLPGFGTIYRYDAKHHGHQHQDHAHMFHGCHF